MKKIQKLHNGAKWVLVKNEEGGFDKRIMIYKSHTGNAFLINKGYEEDFISFGGNTILGFSIVKDCEYFEVEDFEGEDNEEDIKIKNIKDAYMLEIIKLLIPKIEIMIKESNLKFGKMIIENNTTNFL